MENINIAEILKDYPKGTVLYSPLCGECRVYEIYDHLGFDVICEDDTIFSFSYDGKYNYNIMGECCIFPSKENRDWSKFQRPFKDGDIVATSDGRWIGITTGGISDEFMPTYCVLTDKDELHIFLNKKVAWQFNRLATEEEKQKLFDAIKANGYKWNEETKTLEKLVVPKFKVGDRIKHKLLRNRYTIKSIDDNVYGLTNGCRLQISGQDDYELIPNKFDITTLKPFDKVLVRDKLWVADLFGFHDDRMAYKFMCVVHNVNQCIPYNDDTKHLLGTANDCDEYYKNWEL